MLELLAIYTGTSHMCTCHIIILKGLSKTFEALMNASITRVIKPLKFTGHVRDEDCTYR